MYRRIIALSLVAMLAVAAPAGATDGQTVGIGTASTTLDLAELSVTGLPVDTVNLGGLTSHASTIPDVALNALGDGKPFALSSISLPIGGEVTVRSDGNTGRPGETIGIGVGSLTFGDLRATVDDLEARSIVNALTGTVDAGLAGLQVGATGVTSVVSATDATAVNGAVLHDLTIGLTDIIPLDLLNQLPLDVVLGLVDELGLPPLNQTLTRTLRDVRSLVNELEAIETVHGTIDSTQAQLTATGTQLDTAADDLTGALNDLTAVVVDTACTDSALLDTVGGVVDEGTKIIDDAKDVVGGIGGSIGDTVGGIGDTVGGIGDTVGDIGGGLGGTIGLDHNPCHDVQDAIAEVTDIEATIATLNSTIDTLQSTLDDAVEEVNRLLDGLLELIDSLDVSQLPALLRALIDGLAGAELLSIDRLGVGVTSFANADGSSASALCELRGLAVLGQPLGNSCEALEQALADVGALIEDLLAELPIVGAVTGAAVSLPVSLPADVVKVAAPKTHSTPDDERDGDYYVSSSSVQALSLNVASLQLTQVADGLLADLLGQVDALLGEVEGLTGINVDLSAVDAAVGEVLAVVDSLPTGDLLAGVTTPGLDLSALGLDTGSRFSAAGSGLVPVGTPGTPGYVPTTPPAQTPTPAGDLPTTGGGVAAALLLLLAGGGMTWWLRRRPATQP